MDMIICRTRISGQAPLYSYRVLVPLDQLAAHRRHRVVILHVPTPAGRLPCTRLADVLAPRRWFERYLAMHCGLAARLNLVSRRVEAIILQAIFPEMTTRLVPPMLLLDHEPGEVRHRISGIDLNAAFDSLAPRIETLIATDLGLCLNDHRRAA